MSVRINVGHVGGDQPQHEPAAVISQINLTSDDPVFRPVATFLFSLMGLSVLAETYNSADGSQKWNYDDHIVLDASAAHLRLSVLGRPIAESLVRNHWPSNLVLDLEVQSTAYDGTSRLGEIGPFLTSAMQGMFTSFFEQHRKTVEASWGKDPSGWPSVWNFGRIVRNALSHGGNLDIRSPTSVSWKTLTYTQADHGKTVILTELWPGDVIVLMAEMQGALT